MPHYLRYRFPGDVPDDGYPSAEVRARAMAALFIAIPPGELSTGALDSAAILLTDRGTLEWAIGEPIGEELAPWLRLVVSPGGRVAYLDCDPEAMARQSRNLPTSGD